MTSPSSQATLFDVVERPEPEDRAEHQRRLNAARQRRWRQRHTQFDVPIIEAPARKADERDQI